MAGRRRHRNGARDSQLVEPPLLAAGCGRPTESEPVPEGLDWDLWVGPAPDRPYHHAYLPFVWRGWYDFGDGSFGDMGCYSFAGLFKILNLTPTVSVEACSSESWEETYPLASIVHLNFPANGSRPPIKMSWYDGGLIPPRPAGLKERDQRLFQGGERGEGVMYVGDKGILLGGFNGNYPRVYPESPKYQYTPPPRQEGEPRQDPALDQWVEACKGKGPAPLADFEIQSPVTEAFLLGCIAQRFPGQVLEWDTATMRITNSEKLNEHVDPPYRDAYKI